MTSAAAPHVLVLHRRINGQPPEVRCSVSFTADAMVLTPDGALDEEVYPFESYSAQRAHPKLAMLRMRYLNPPMELFFSFEKLERPFEAARQFGSAFTAAFGAWRDARRGSPRPKPEAAPPAGAAAPAGATAPAAASSPPSESPSRSAAISSAATPVIAVVNLEQDQLEREREALLQEEPSLSNAYTALVGQFLTADEFWTQHKGDLEGLLSQEPGMSSNTNFLANPPAILEDGDKPAKVTEEQIESVLKEDPYIRDLYNKTVPEKFTRDEFWARYFLSEYCAESAGRPTAKAVKDSLFGVYDIDRIKPLPPTATVWARTAKDVDLISAQEFERPGFGSSLATNSFVGDLAAAQDNKKKSLLQRFNRHAMDLVERSTHRPLLQPELRLRPTDFEDLSSAPPPSLPILVKAARRPQQQQQQQSQQPQQQSAEQMEVPTAGFVGRVAVMANSPQNSLPALPAGAAWSLSLLNLRLVQMDLLTRSAAVVVDSLSEEDLNLLSAVATEQQCLKELLQHFWSCELKDTEKMERLVWAIKSKIENIKRALVTLPPKGSNAAINTRAAFQLLVDAGKIALARYEDLRRLQQQK